MFDIVRNNKTVAQVVLALITLPFAFWGVESYMRSINSGTPVATVSGYKITQEEFSQAQRNQQDRLRQMLGRNFDPTVFDSSEARAALVDQLIDQHLLIDQVIKANLTVGDDQLRSLIASIPALQENGQFSRERYEAALKAQGRTPAIFEAQLRQDMQQQQLRGVITESGFLANAVVERLAAIAEQSRDIAEFVIKPEQFAAGVKITPEQIKAYYEANIQRFEIPELVRAEYLVLSADVLAAQSPVSSEEIKAAYDANIARYKQDEERRASHILIAFPSDGKDADKAKTRAKAEEVLKQVQKYPAKFTELAKTNSDDPGSKKTGGDLGFFTKGAMVPSFDAAAFSMKINQISGLVESEFGFHIIKVTDIKGGTTKPLDAVRAEIEKELKTQKAQKKYLENAESFTNMIYEQSESLKPAAEKFKLTVAQAPFIAKNGQGAPALLNNPKLLGALFSDDAIKNKRNTEAVEVTPGTLVAAHVMEHKPAATRPLDEVKGDIAKFLQQQQIVLAAKAEGEAKLAALRKGADTTPWSPVRTISRQDAKGLPPVSAQGVFKTDATKLPAYTGVVLPGGAYAIYKISKVTQPEKIDPVKVAQLKAQFSQMKSETDFIAYLAALRANAKIEIDKAQIEKK